MEEVKQLRNNKEPGVSEITAKMLKEADEMLAQTIHNMPDMERRINVQKMGRCIDLCI